MWRSVHQQLPNRGRRGHLVRRTPLDGGRHQARIPQQTDLLRRRAHLRAVGGHGRPLRLQHGPRQDEDQGRGVERQISG